MDGLEQIYAPHFEYHACAWLQTRLSESFLELNGATQEDLQLYFKNAPFIERVWSQLSTSLRANMLATDFGVSVSRSGWQAEVDRVMEQCRKYSSLTPAEQTKLLDKKFTDVRSKPPQFPHNLHVHRNLNQPATSVIASMSPNNWPGWKQVLSSM